VQTETAATPLSRDEIEARLDRLLDPVLSSRRTAAPLAEPAALLDAAQQRFLLHWATVVARTNIELAFQFVSAAPRQLAALDPDTAEEWIVSAMDVYDRDGLHAATQVFASPRVAATNALDPHAVRLDDIANFLRLFVNGLAGRQMRIDSAPYSYTDTETLYLPPRIDRGAAVDENLFLYKAIAVLLWAQTRYGTFSIDVQAACETFPDTGKALRLFNLLEIVRLEAKLSAMLPALVREMRALRAPMHDGRLAALARQSATAQTTVAVLHAVYDSPPVLDDPYGIVLEPERARACRALRIAREKADFQSALARLDEEHRIAAETSTSERYSLRQADAPASERARYSLTRDGEALAVPVEFAELIDSVVQDLGTVPDDYLVLRHDRAAEAADNGDGANDAEPRGDPARVFYYDEWDYFRRHYRKSWCVLRERDTDAGDTEFVAATLAKYAANIAQLRRTFELMRGEERLLKRQPDGDGIDLDALLEAYGDMRAGSELSPLVFTKRQKHDRDLAVMFMVDMSGSTKGWINQAEREALVMLCEALEVLGDRYAIYGFSGMTRKRCEVYRIKQFDEPYGPSVHERIAGIQPQDYTRMGAAIRHLTTLLNRVEARTKLLITLSDGKPDDYGSEYRGEYGIEDTRHALIEAHRSGIKPFCITIDSEAREYLPHMYGAANWTLVDDVSRLPTRVATIYQRLTT
jgi:nitric oxide reductase NorD protein